MRQRKDKGKKIRNLEKRRDEREKNMKGRRKGETGKEGKDK